MVGADELPAEAAAPTIPAPVVEVDESRQAAELLGYYQRVAGLGLEEQKRELATATQSLNRERTNASRVRLALIYSIPGTAFQDDARPSCSNRWHRARAPARSASSRASCTRRSTTA